MADENQRTDPTANEETGTAGHETGIEEPSDVGSAGLYATPIHDEAEEADDADDAGRQNASG